MKTAKVIVASRNSHKIEEIGQILAEFGLEAVGRDDAGIPPFEVEETGETFEENSYIKAKAIMDISKLPVVADDSGLSVDFLNGAPGVYSARFAGDGAQDEDNNAKLLELMKDVPQEKRTAHFVSVVTLLFPDGECITARGECHGRILTESRGEGGFGYDPLFLPDGYEKTFAELAGPEKNKISHRGKALSELKLALERR